MIVEKYLINQRKHYEYSLKLGQTDCAWDAVWRAASHVEILNHTETSHHRLTPERKQELLKQLGWTA